jgi:hypothetical protein
MEVESEPEDTINQLLDAAEQTAVPLVSMLRYVVYCTNSACFKHL